MAEDTYEVIGVDELTVPRTVSKLAQPDGSFIYQNGMARTYLQGETIAADDVAEDIREALDSGEGPLYEAIKDKLKKGSGEASEDIARRLGLPFEGYDDMEANDIVTAMSVLPSATIQRIKEYEGNRDEPRPEIVDYSIGYGESPVARQTTELEETELDENKAVRRLKTREVPEEGPVEPGEGFTGTGDAQIPYGVHADEEEGDEPTASAARASRAGKGRGSISTAKARRGRRDRQPKPPAGAGEGGTSLESQND
jgi:hypothetical protein